jgi:hypothetical protein
MFNKKNLIMMAFLLLQFGFFSCKKEEPKINHQTQKYAEKWIDYKLEFPDTVYVNELNEGIIRYKSILDTVTTSFDDKKNKRYVMFYLTTVDKPYKDYKKIKKSKQVFGADNNKLISLYDIKFDKTGIYYIDGIINDYVVIDINKKDSKGNELVREIEKEDRVTRKVVVINKK